VTGFVRQYLPLKVEWAENTFFNLWFYFFIFVYLFINFLLWYSSHRDSLCGLVVGIVRWRTKAPEFVLFLFIAHSYIFNALPPTARLFSVKWYGIPNRYGQMKKKKDNAISWVYRQGIHSHNISTGTCLYRHQTYFSTPWFIFNKVRP
jgi:hypothetical protein